ncbi:MAG: ROK family protein, partial [Candidatus Dormibacteraceae bacterium]
TWSTGIGCGLVVEGRLYSGAHGTAGEVGHMVLDPGGPLCACGQRGCLEAYAGGEGIRRRTGARAVDVCRAALAGEPGAVAVMEDAARHFGQALVNLTNLVDPELIVVGGGLSRSWRLLRRTVSEAMRSSPFISPYRRPKLLRTRLGDRVGLVGAVEWGRLNM